MDIEKITPKELHDRLKHDENPFILDVRSEEKYREEHVEGSKNLPKTIIFEQNEADQDFRVDLPKQDEIIVTCTTGNSALKCAKILDEHNYKVKVLEGGLTAWNQYLKSL